MNFEKRQILIVIFALLAEVDDDLEDMGPRVTEAIVKLGKHTRRIKISVHPGRRFLKSLKLTVIETFRDVMQPERGALEQTSLINNLLL